MMTGYVNQTLIAGLPAVLFLEMKDFFDQFVAEGQPKMPKSGSVTA